MDSRKPGCPGLGLALLMGQPTSASVGGLQRRPQPLPKETPHCPSVCLGGWAPSRGRIVFCILPCRTLDSEMFSVRDFFLPWTVLHSS